MIITRIKQPAIISAHLVITQGRAIQATVNKNIYHSHAKVFRILVHINFLVFPRSCVSYPAQERCTGRTVSMFRDYALTPSFE